MKEFELIKLFISYEKQLNNYDYSVNTLTNGFYISNPKGKIVAECQTVDGLRTFMQALEMIEAEKNRI